MSPEEQQALQAYAEALRAKITGSQGGVGTFADHLTLEVMSQLAGGDPHIDSADVQRLLEAAARRAEGRYVDYASRNESRVPDAPPQLLIDSQGAFDCLAWNGLPLFKTAWDFALYPMLLSELRPRTIIELGSGTGASAVWLADVSAMLDVPCEIYSVDLEPPSVTRNGVHFIAGDCGAITAALPDEQLRRWPHPWLVLEDAHENVVGVLKHLHPHLAPGDYVIVEDSRGKTQELHRFLTRTPDCYLVDTRYTDFFGRNVTSAADSILRRSDD
jgi:cephalosporin hydroxylase